MTKPEATKVEANADDDKPADKKPDYLRKFIEILQDRCEETGKDLEAPPIVRKVLNIIFLVLGVSLLLGVLIAVIVTVVLQDDGRGHHNLDAIARELLNEQPTSFRPPVRKAMYVSWPPRVLETPDRTLIDEEV